MPSKLDVHVVMIVGKYFNFEEDYLNLISTNSKFKDVLDRYHYNPISSLRLFKNVETQYLYKYNDQPVDGMFQYKVCYRVTYKMANAILKAHPNTTFRETVLTNNNILKWKKDHPECVVSNRNDYSVLVSIDVPKCCNVLDTNCFAKCYELTAITLPSIVKSIFDSGLDCCTKLERIFIERCASCDIAVPFWMANLINKSGCFCSNIYFSKNDVTYYKQSHPEDVENDALRRLNIPDVCNAIGQKCFLQCKQLTAVTLPTKLSSIEPDAFGRMCSIKKIAFFQNTCECKVPFWVSRLLEKDGVKCSKVAFTLNDVDVWKIEHPGDLEGENITRIELPSKCVEICEYAFSCCDLHSIEIPANVSSIGTLAFEGNPHLTKVVLDSKIESIEFDCFSGCKELETIEVKNCETFDVRVPYFVAKLIHNVKCTNVVFAFCDDKKWKMDHAEDVVHGSANALCRIAVPEICNEIGAFAFEGNRSLTSVTLPTTITSIGYGSFWNCDFLTAIEIPEACEYLAHNAFCNCFHLCRVVLPKYTKVSPTAFANCQFIPPKEQPTYW
ncbi:hypothetical protein EIN_026150 [Entamoeba invadens IP1]|uniref:hypothetical protein n=1 Tax=Entamoeba invadens IP1 TaxID=370355 RepID=UPI0002C3F2AC|nr:hypothetical protein EIN_026150 [Entamoeba invadens IP1]ELP90766.1 hypothetical protein EIN_026150 [Entamoeba invadens IP1]|eukprot:XP_004257537.1 hypothetical protein EIN_026150 [Entamoeba invadens IP1]